MNTTTIPRSWAQIVKGQSEIEEAAPEQENEGLELEADIPQNSQVEVPVVEPPVCVVEAQEPFSAPAAEMSQQAPLQEIVTENLSAGFRPGVRGSLECFCRGEVLSMLSHYGWLRVFGHVDHPLAVKHFGRIYVHNKDVVDGRTLQVGDQVSFYLYADAVGLGAESCRVLDEEYAPPAKLRADAAEFVPGGTFAGSAKPVADMFVRMSRTFESIPANGYVQMFGVINNSYFVGDSSDDEDDDDVNADADRESLQDESDSSSFESDAAVMVSQAPWRKKVDTMKTKAVVHSRPESPGRTSDSTTAGFTSDSDGDGKVHLQSLLKAHLGHEMPNFRPPPGLEEFGPVFLS